MIIAALVPIFGLLLVLVAGHRIFKTHPTARTLSVFVACACPFIARNILLSWILIGSFALILRGVVFFSERGRNSDLARALPQVLDGVLMSMKAGLSLKSAVRDIVRELSPPLGARLTEIADRLALAGEEDGLSAGEREILRTFRRLEQGTGRAIERLEAWRRDVRLREEFRRRSAQATLQTRSQAAICGALFVPALIWNMKTADDGAIARILTASCLFLIAQIWIHTFYRRVKWTV